MDQARCGNKIQKRLIAGPRRPPHSPETKTGMVLSGRFLCRRPHRNFMLEPSAPQAVGSPTGFGQGDPIKDGDQEDGDLAMPNANKHRRLDATNTMLWQSVKAWVT